MSGMSGVATASVVQPRVLVTGPLPYWYAFYYFFSPPT